MLSVQSNGRGVPSSAKAAPPGSIPWIRSSGAIFPRRETSSTLASGGGGLYELSDANGNVTRFRADGRIDYAADPNGNTVTAELRRVGPLGLAHAHFQGRPLPSIIIRRG